MKVQGDVPDEDAKMGVTTKTKQKPRNQFHQSRIHLCSAATKSSELLKIKSAWMECFSKEDKSVVRQPNERPGTSRVLVEIDMERSKLKNDDLLIVIVCALKVALDGKSWRVVGFSWASNSFFQALSCAMASLSDRVSSISGAWNGIAIDGGM